MRVLIACEESQEVCKAFRARGHAAYSCDIQECSGGHPEWLAQWPSSGDDIKEDRTMNNNLLSASRLMQNLLQELCEADVRILAARIDMDYNTPKPHPFRFSIHAWDDENFTRWAVQYHTNKNEERHETSVPFLDGQVYVLND